MNEATSRIKINRLLEAAGWRFFDDADGPANIRLEQHVALQPADLDGLGDDFENAGNGFVDFLLLDGSGFPLIVLEAKSEDKEPLTGKEQARAYARSLNCRFVILSNGSIHWFWDLELGNPRIISQFPSPDSVVGYKQVTPNPHRLTDEQVNDDYIALTRAALREASERAVTPQAQGSPDAGGRTRNGLEARLAHADPDAERKLRVQLAGLFRISAHLGWEDSFNTHYTARVPGTDPPRFLMNPYGVRFDEMKASDLVTVDLDGNVVEETEYQVNEAGFVIHSAIHRDRHDAHCVIHTHTHAGMAVAALAHGLLPIGIFALGFHESVSYHDFEGGSGRHNMSERERLAESLGPTNNAMIMRNHGLLTVGASVPEAFVWMFRLNRACEVQVLTHGAGGEYVVPSAVAAANTATATRDFVSAYGSGEPGEAEFNAFLRAVERQDGSFRS